jgi:lipopolysaccharide export system protein LptA
MTGSRLILTGIAGALTLTGLSLTGMALAQQGVPPDTPTRIYSDSGELFQNEGRGFYTGHVVVTRGEARLTTDKLTGICGKAAAGGDGKPDCNNIDPLIAEGNVLYTTSDVKIRGDKAVYQSGANVVTVTGDVIMTRGEDCVMRGTEIVYSVDEGKVKVTAGSNRVLSICTPKKKDGAAAPAPAPAAPSPASRPN